jgi:hypothetical protein
MQKKRSSKFCITAITHISKFIGNGSRTEYLRMPAEMKETVKELVAEINQMAIDYA